MTVLRIDASARLEASNSRILTNYLVESLVENPGKAVIERDLAQQPLPMISAEDLIDLHASAALSRESLKEHSELSDNLIAELMEADDVVFGVPVYNFGIPVVLKQWVDYICRAGVTFTYGKNGPVGLTGIKRAFIVTSSGGVPIGSDMDYASRYMEQICRFIGVEEVIHIDASGSKGAPEIVIAGGKAQIDNVLAKSGESVALGEA